MSGDSGKPNQVVLIADDSSTVRKFVTFSLSAQNLEVITAVDGMDALEKVSQASRVDLRQCRIKHAQYGWIRVH